VLIGLAGAEPHQWLLQLGKKMSGTTQLVL